MSSVQPLYKSSAKSNNSLRNYWWCNTFSPSNFNVGLTSRRGPDYPLCRLYHGRAPVARGPRRSAAKFLPRCFDVWTFSVRLNVTTTRRIKRSVNFFGKKKCTATFTGFAYEKRAPALRWYGAPEWLIRPCSRRFSGMRCQTLPNVGRTSAFTKFVLHVLLHFGTQAAQRRVLSKIETKFRPFCPSKNYRRGGRNVWVKNQGCGVLTFCGTPTPGRKIRLRFRLYDLLCEILSVYFRAGKNLLF